MWWDRGEHRVLEGTEERPLAWALEVREGILGKTQRAKRGQPGDETGKRKGPMKRRGVCVCVWVGVRV